MANIVTLSLPQHKASKAVEYMINDAMLEADAVWNRRLSNSIDDVESFQKMTDHVLREIENSVEPGLKKAQSIVRRM